MLQVSFLWIKALRLKSTLRVSLVVCALRVGVLISNFSRDRESSVCFNPLRRICSIIAKHALLLRVFSLWPHSQHTHRSVCSWYVRTLTSKFFGSVRNISYCNSVANRLKPKLVKIIFKNSFRTANTTQHLSITKISWLSQFKVVLLVIDWTHRRRWSLQITSSVSVLAAESVGKPESIAASNVTFLQYYCHIALDVWDLSEEI
jgi:hypothetical protein